MKLEHSNKAYKRYAPVYDAVFGAVLQPGRKRIVEHLECRPGERILEVGVGTGLSLPLYPPAVAVTGIDASPEMLARARARVARRGLSQVAAVEQMDALDMAFADASFDKAVLMYVVSVVDDVRALIAEVRRVLRPGGELVIVNHFQSTAGVARGIEGALAPLASRLGFHTDLALDGFLEETGLVAEAVVPVNLFGYWKLVRCRVPGAVKAPP